MKVKATNKYKELNVEDAELKRIPEKGEEFEVTEERYKVLTETNSFNAVFVEKVEEVEATKKVETAIKKTNKTIERKKKQ